MHRLGTPAHLGLKQQTAHRPSRFSRSRRGSPIHPWQLIRNSRLSKWIRNLKWLETHLSISNPRNRGLYSPSIQDCHHASDTFQVAFEDGLKVGASRLCLLQKDAELVVDKETHEEEDLRSLFGKRIQKDRFLIHLPCYMIKV